MRALVAAAAVVALAGCGGGGKSTAPGTIVTTTTTTSVTVTTHGRFHYSPALERSYMKACTKNGTVTEAACACTLDKLSNSVSTRDFSRMTLTGLIPPRIRKAIVRAANACRGG